MPGLGGFGGGRRRRAIDILMLSVRNAPYKKVLVLSAGWLGLGGASDFHASRSRSACRHGWTKKEERVAE